MSRPRFPAALWLKIAAGTVLFSTRLNGTFYFCPDTGNTEMFRRAAFRQRRFGLVVSSGSSHAGEQVKLLEARLLVTAQHECQRQDSEPERAGDLPNRRQLVSLLCFSKWSVATASIFTAGKAMAKNSGLCGDEVLNIAAAFALGMTVRPLAWARTVTQAGNVRRRGRLHRRQRIKIEAVAFHLAGEAHQIERLVDSPSAAARSSCRHGALRAVSTLRSAGHGETRLQAFMERGTRRQFGHVALGLR